MLILQCCFGFPRRSPGTSTYGYNNRCFLVALWCMIVSRPSFGCSNQEAFPSSGKNTGVVLVPCHAWKWVPAARFGGCNIPKVCRCHLSQWMSSQWGLQKLLYRKDQHLMNLEPAHESFFFGKLWRFFLSYAFAWLYPVLYPELFCSCYTSLGSQTQTPTLSKV